MYDITDADGDGVEDAKKRTRDDLDMFYYPNVMGEAGMDVENTRHGGMPGNVNKEWLDNAMPEPTDTYTLVKKPVFHSVNTEYAYGDDSDIYKWVLNNKYQLRVRVFKKMKPKIL